MKKSNQKNSEKTLYPKIFKDTYWGVGSMDEDANRVIENRNEFVESHGIKSGCSKSLKYVWNFLHTLDKDSKDIHFDHTEVYKTDDGRFIILNSPYGNYDEPCKEKGWIKEKELYPGANSYSKYFTLEEVKKPKTNTELIKNFYDKHPEHKNKIKCDICGQEYRYFNKSKHIKTKIHKIFAEK